METAPHHAREWPLSGHAQEMETLPQGQMRRHVQREPGAAEVRSRQPERSLGRRHHLRQDGVRLGVPCLGVGPVQQGGGGLRREQEHRYRTCQARVVQCHHATRPSRQTDLPFRPWRAVQQHGLPNDALGEWDNALNECSGVSLRQRLHGKLLRKLQEGDGLQAGLQGHRRRAGGRFQVHRAVLQPETAP